MKIWLLKTGEALPFNSDQNLMRTGRLAKFLSSEGHDILWWTSSFCHQTKTQLLPSERIVTINEKYKIILLKSIAYRKNISLLRLINHLELGVKFFIKSLLEKKPDLIISSFPIIELCFASVVIGRIRAVPVILDVRDKWPLIFYESKSGFKRNLTKFFCFPYYLLSYLAFQGCNGVTGVSSGYLNWASKYFGLKIKEASVIEIGFNKNVIELEQYNELPSKHINENKFKVFWFFGSLGDTYDLHTIIKSFNSLKYTTRKKIKLIISGDGHQLELLQNLPVQFSIEFTGWLHEKGKNYFGRLADFGLLSYKKGAPQGLPNKLFDYLNFGIPIISALRGEGQKFIEDNSIGWSYQPGDHKSLQILIEHLIKNPTKVYNTQKHIKEDIIGNYTDNVTNKKWDMHINKIINKYK